MSRKKDYIYIKILGVILIGAIAFWFLAVLAYECFNFGVIDEKGIILSLVGILATFVVVSNYMQLKEIKSEFSLQINEIERKIFIKNQKEMHKFLSLSNVNIADSLSSTFGWSVNNVIKHMGLAILEAKKSEDEKTINDVLIEAERYYNRELFRHKKDINESVFNDFINGLKSISQNYDLVNKIEKQYLSVETDNSTNI